MKMFNNPMYKLQIAPGTRVYFVIERTEYQETSDYCYMDIHVRISEDHTFNLDKMVRKRLFVSENENSEWMIFLKSVGNLLRDVISFEPSDFIGMRGTCIYDKRESAKTFELYDDLTHFTFDLNLDGIKKVNEKILIELKEEGVSID